MSTGIEHRAHRYLSQGCAGKCQSFIHGRHSAVSDEWKLKYREVALSLAQQEYADRECDRLKREAVEQLRKCEEYLETWKGAAERYRAQLAKLESEIY